VDEHYRIDAEVVHQVMNVLGQLPYNQVHALIASIRARSSGPHEGPAVPRPPKRTGTEPS